MIKTLRASGTAVLADVVIGKNDYGSDVTVAVRLTRKDAALTNALYPLEKLLKERALEHVTTAYSEQAVQAQVAARLAEQIEPARERIAKHAKETAERDLKRERETREAKEREIDRLTEAVRKTHEESVNLREQIKTMREQMVVGEQP